LKIGFTEHANQRIRILGRHGVKVTKRLVEKVLNDPERVVPGLGGRQIAEQGLEENYRHNFGCDSSQRL